MTEYSRRSMLCTTVAGLSGGLAPALYAGDKRHRPRNSRSMTPGSSAISPTATTAGPRWLAAGTGSCCWSVPVAANRMSVPLDESN
ncbi:MAG: hypothetical protein Ct9H300mP1_29170 [Planctomycetaceae bacterium]|nr:MAG: hypothetical protein Ct9H300mP1_29170 [Planctomycetaceae bacterium]